MSTSRFDLRALRDTDELKAVGTQLGEELKADDVASLAAAVAFKIVLALFPALLAAVAIFALVIEPSDIQALVATLPPDITALVEDQLEEFIAAAASGGIAIGGIAAGLWAASSAAATLNKALTRAYDQQEDRKIVGQRGAALAVTVALLVALIAIAILLVAGGSIEDRILAALPLTDTARVTADLASTTGRYLVMILLLMILFAFIYWIGPDYEQRPSWRWITPGAALAVIVWLLASAGFGWYVQNFGSYTESDSVYGPLGSAIVFMLWLQLSMFALLLGAEVNQVLVVRARARRSTAAGDAGSLGVDVEGGETAPVGATAGGATGGDGARTRTAAASLRAATTPVRGRTGARPHAARSRGVGTAGSGGGANGAGGDRRARQTRQVDVGAHARSGDPSRANGDAPAGGERSVPTETLIGAGVAAVSGLVGLTGLLRRLRD